MGKITAICISETKGTAKHSIKSCQLIENHGLMGDAHAGSERQVSLLPREAVYRFDKNIAPGAFGENLIVEGFDLKSYKVGSRFICNDVLLELTQIGKQCHTGCDIAKQKGRCIMPSEGVFARVLCGGVICEGDEIFEVPDSVEGHMRFTAAVLTASDRSYRGEREDASGPLLVRLLQSQGYDVVYNGLFPDDEDMISSELVRLADDTKPNVIFTTGGTGFSSRDCMPEATLKVADRIAPGISEALRAQSLLITPNAMFSRAVSVIRGSTLIINLPGSPRAISECLSFLLPNMSHGLLILRGEADG